MGMEDDTRQFLLLIVNTIALVLLWMMISTVLGIYFDFAFFDGLPGWKNILFYVFFFTTLRWLVRFLYRKWRGYF